MLEKHYRLAEILSLTGLSRSTVYELMRKGQFPRPVNLSARAVAWPESVIAEWLASRERTAA